MARQKQQQTSRKPGFSKLMEANLAKSRLKVSGGFVRDVDDESRIRGWLPSGCRVLDLAMGGRGYAFERISTIHGPPQGGKSALGIAACVEAQHIIIGGERGAAHYIEYEGGFDPALAKARGLVFEPGYDSLEDRLSTTEDMFEYIEILCNSTRESDNPERLLCVVIDSVTAMPTDEELNHEDKWRSKTMGSQARSMSKNLKLLRSVMRGLNIVVILISQDRAKIQTGVSQQGTTPSGGNAPGYYASHVLTVKAEEDMYRTATEAKIPKRSMKHLPTGIKMNVFVRKSRSGAPHRVVNIPFHFDRGIDQYEADFWMLREFDRLIRHGKTSDKYTLVVGKKEHDFVGVKGFKQLLASDPAIDRAIWRMMQEDYRIKVPDFDKDEKEEDERIEKLSPKDEKKKEKLAKAFGKVARAAEEALEDIRKVDQPDDDREEEDEEQDEPRPTPKKREADPDDE